MTKHSAPFGSWKSAISARLLADAGVRYGHIQVDSGNLYWLQSQPEHNGRQTIYMYSSDGSVKDMIPTDYGVRSRVHEYGGGDFAVCHGKLVFVNAADQCLYLCSPEGTVRALTEESELKMGVRYADMHFHPSGDWLVAVREQHKRANAPAEVVNDIVMIDLNSSTQPRVLVTGDDYYAYPRISNDGNQMAWISWNHPDMPWDNTSLYRADIANQDVSNIRAYMEEDEEAIYQPSWSPDGELHFVSDRSGWWNIYSLKDDILNALTPMRAEFGYPMWQLGVRSYQFIDDARIAAVISHDGMEQLCLVETDTGHIAPFDLPFCNYQGGLQLDGETLYFIAASSTQSAAVYQYHYPSNTLEMISGAPDPINNSISEAQSIYFPSTDGQKVHAFFYPPSHDAYIGTKDEKPPVIVMIHGGPTGATNPSYQLGIQFWTNRGFSVVDINYRGSTGFGRAYRNILRYQWGIADVEDCTAVIEHLNSEGLIDPERVAIRGGSAGGYTVYRALQESGIFKAGVSRYGVADLTALAKDTHKFELRYLDRLIGEYPKEADRYEALSPINHSDKFSCPLLILQGDEDAVVPPSQSIQMAKALDEKGIPHEIVLLQGEQHGFRQRDNIIMAIELELNFYRQVFNIKADEELAELRLKHSPDIS